ncbi:MAG: LuxR C-terminal-related transcriptional regulator [Pseudomonadota bacterium]
MGVSERTVAFHLANARSKMGARTREAQAAKVWRLC